MDNFERIVIADVTVEIVYLVRATIFEVKKLKDIIDEDIKSGVKKLVIDLSRCQFMDSTFIGVLVEALKNITNKSGKLHLVKPASIAHRMLEDTRILKIFDVYDTREEAINSF